MKNLLVLTKTNNPYRNNAIESVLFDAYTHYESILLLWVNDPSVVLGRNQNPWREVAVDQCLKSGVEVVRRQSGGGTVYHDHGNLNFSFIKSHKQYDEMSHFKTIQEAMATFGIDLSVSKRKDLLCGDFKVSGNAFYLKGKRRMHHGTLLIDADLPLARSVLRAKDEGHLNRFKSGRFIPSVSSPIMNLKEAALHLTVSGAINAIVDAFYRENQYAVDILSEASILQTHQETILALEDKYRSWDWTYGETPQFVYNMAPDVDIFVKSGRVERLSNVSKQDIEYLENNQIRR